MIRGMTCKLLLAACDLSSVGLCFTAVRDRNKESTMRTEVLVSVLITKRRRAVTKVLSSYSLGM